LLFYVGAMQLSETPELPYANDPHRVVVMRQTRVSMTDRLG